MSSDAKLEVLTSGKRDSASSLGEHADDTIVRILELVERPDVTSFAGGFPASDAQPWRGLRDLMIDALGDVRSREIFGYGPTLGLTRLRELVAARMATHGRTARLSEVLITAGGIAGLDLIAGTLAKPGDRVAVSNPSYVGALEVFRNHRLHVMGIQSTEQGLDLSELRYQAEAAAKSGNPIKFLYLVPSFDNPTGTTMSLAQRMILVDLAAIHGFRVLEDGAYQELYFDERPPPMLACLAPQNVIHINTFSKTLCPGFRLGWIVAPAEIISSLCRRKQTWDQCSSTVGQRVVIEALENGFFDDQVAHARRLYKRRRNRLLGALDENLTGLALWNRPAGGFFIWLRLQGEIDASRVAAMALTTERIAVLPGENWFVDSPDPATLRLAFSGICDSKIGAGIEGLRKCIEKIQVKTPGFQSGDELISG